MVKLLIIADDFTGALDTGIQFVNNHKKTTYNQFILKRLMNIAFNIYA